MHPIRLSLALFAMGCAQAEAPAAPPNVVLVVIDTARADHLGMYGYPRPTSPQLDAFARDAVTYRSVTSPGAWTVPSHGSLFTGLPPSLHGLHWSGAAAEGEALPPMLSPLTDAAKQRLLARVLSDRGYTTLAVSANPWVEAITELDQGFDRFYPIPRKLKRHRAAFRSWSERYKVSAEIDARRGGLSLAMIKKDFSDNEVAAPYLLFLNLIEPHFPYAPKQGFAGRFGGDPDALAALRQQHGRFELSMLAGLMQPGTELLTNLYDEEIAYCDALLGHLFAWLRERGEYDDALIIVTSDHGEHLGEGGRYSHQLSMERELLDVPLLVKFPGNVGGGTVEAHPLISTTDVYRTVLAAAGVQTPASPWSQDLARMDSFERRFALAESFFSDRYLAQLVELNPEFDPAPHRVTQRVVVTPQGRLLFRDGDLVARGADWLSDPPAGILE